MYQLLDLSELDSEPVGDSLSTVLVTTFLCTIGLNMS